MQNLEDLRHKYFIDCKKLISELLFTENFESLIENKSKVDELSEKISFLKGLNENPELFHHETVEVLTEPEVESPANSNFNAEFEDTLGAEMEIIEEESKEEVPVFEFALNDEPVTDLIEEEVIKEVDETPQESMTEIHLIKQPVESAEIEKENAEEPVFEADLVEDIFEVKAEEFEAVTLEEESRRKILDIDKSDEVLASKEEYFEETVVQRKPAEKKFKLAHIKGLKSVQTLFDDDPLEHEPAVEETKTAGSLLKSNVPTDFMEAEKPKPEFKLDLNDRIAFTKTLFGGSQTDLNETVSALNSFKTLDEAKEYLSDVYYRKNWKKADEYAQRLWQLVESKFQ